MSAPDNGMPRCPSCAGNAGHWTNPVAAAMAMHAAQMEQHTAPTSLQAYSNLALNPNSGLKAGAKTWISVQTEPSPPLSSGYTLECALLGSTCTVDKCVTALQDPFIDVPFEASGCVGSRKARAGSHDQRTTHGRTATGAAFTSPSASVGSQPNYTWVKPPKVTGKLAAHRMRCFAPYLPPMLPSEAALHSVCSTCNRCHECRGEGYTCHPLECKCRRCLIYRKSGQAKARTATQRNLASEQDELLARTAEEMRIHMAGSGVGRGGRAGSAQEANGDGAPASAEGHLWERSVNVTHLPLPDAEALGSDDPYMVLGFPDIGDDASLRRRFRQLALAFHPDKSTSGHTQAQSLSDAFIAVSHAYQCIQRMRGGTWL